MDVTVTIPASVLRDACDEIAERVELLAMFEQTPERIRLGASLWAFLKAADEAMKRLDGNSSSV